MENEVNKRKISDYFNLPTMRQTERIAAFKEEDKLHKNTIKLASNAYIFGIEVEVEGVHHPTVNAAYRSYWDITEDHSLRNDGVEFVSVPLRGNQIEGALNQLAKSLPPTHIFSPRTSVHVHMNVRDLLIDQITGLVLLYTVMEEMLFDYAGAERHNNVFCVKLTDTNYVENYRRFQINPEDVVNHWNKYTAMNLLPMASKGTVEFRHMAGTIDVKHIITWINLLACLKTYAKNTPLPLIIAEIYQLNSSSMYEVFMDRIFGEWAKHILPKDGSLQSKMENAISYVKLANIDKTRYQLKQPTNFLNTAPNFDEWLMETTTRIAETPAPPPRNHDNARTIGDIVRANRALERNTRVQPTVTIEEMIRETIPTPTLIFRTPEGVM